MRSNRGSSKGVIFIAGAFILLLVVAALLFGSPPYNVWRQRLAGEAELARAEYNRQIAVREAEATREASTLLALAEIERAKGVAEANSIIGDSLQGNDDYLRYLWVQGVNSGGNSIIYVPTEGNLPILEAGQR